MVFLTLILMIFWAMLLTFLRFLWVRLESLRLMIRIYLRLLFVFIIVIRALTHQFWGNFMLFLTKEFDTFLSVKLLEVKPCIGHWVHFSSWLWRVRHWVPVKPYFILVAKPMLLVGHYLYGLNANKLMNWLAKTWSYSACIDAWCLVVALKLSFSLIESWSLLKKKTFPVACALSECAWWW